MSTQEMRSLCLKPAPGAMSRKERFGALLVSGNLPILSLNEDALKIWELCNGQRTIAEIEALLLEEYKSEGLPDRMWEFIRYCLESGLLVSVKS